ncbi:MAG: GIY-YIG nuclease family protein [Candidatus Babeliaceae bacterium]|nr:GIY-YIG nuclease family protein [Candidatus Babeliaceae bacterium]
MKNVEPSSFPPIPGVYVFKAADGTILYIGKAKNLHNRIRSYFQKTGDEKTAQLIAAHDSIGYIPTRNEIEALLLEAHLIKIYQPPLNVLLKSGQPFLYLVFTKPKDPKKLPELIIMRQKPKTGIIFGPFTHKREVRVLYEHLIRTFHLLLCGKQVAQGCLDYHLGRCAGTCRPDFNREVYERHLSLAQALLQGDRKTFVKEVEKEISAANARLDFEQSQHLHELLQQTEFLFTTLESGFSTARYARFTQAVLSPTLPNRKEYEEAANELKKLLHLKTLPQSIDCFDVSHFQSHALVGACVRFVNGVPAPDKYRRFRIKTLNRQDDYAALQEIVSRRYREGDHPDIILIDGGKGQRNAVESLVAPTPCISLAKREETLITAEHPDGIKLDVATPLGKLLISLRNQTHYQAISYHRIARARSSSPS